VVRNIFAVRVSKVLLATSNLQTLSAKGPKAMLMTIALYHLNLLLINISDETSADFNDLGRKLIGGFVLAVVIAVVFTFVKLRLRDKKPPAQFISISPFREPDEPRRR
jgi:hypothetical protein